MDCGMSIVKYLLFAFNLLCSLAGLALVIMGALVQTQMKDIVDHMDQGKFSVPSIVVIVIGSIVFILAFLGCCGAARESHSMLISYAVLLCCVFVVEIIIAVLAFVYRSDFEKAIETTMATWYADYGTSSEEKAIVNDIQRLVHCCGLHSPTQQWSTGPYPPSCCGLPDSTTTTNTTMCKNAYHRGCLSAVTDIGSWAGNVVGGVAIGICVIEVVGIIFACCLANSIKNESRRRYA